MLVSIFAGGTAMRICVPSKALAIEDIAQCGCITSAMSSWSLKRWIEAVAEMRTRCPRARY